MASIGDAVKFLRTQFGAPQRWLAEQVGVSQQTIARWERGGAVPTKYLRDLAVALGCTISDLVEGGEPQSYIARVAAKRAGRFEGEIDDSGVEFGTLRLRFLPSVRELLNRPSASDESADPRLSVREYPISSGERQRLANRLDDRGERFLTWFSFQALDNRLVFVNRSQLESLEMVGEVIEAPPHYEHEEIYRALADWRVQRVLEGGEPLENFDAKDAPYSRATIERCFALADAVGGVNALLSKVNCILAEAIDGRVLELYFDEEQEETFNELSLLDIELDATWSADQQCVNDWLVELGSEGWERSSLYRLGALRVIEVPLQKYLDAQRRELKEMDEHFARAQEQEEQDGQSKRSGSA